MSTRKNFSRSDAIHKEHCNKDVISSKVDCDTSELKEFITKWTQNEQFAFDKFADILELVGVKTPVKLSELNMEKQCFKCLTAINTEVLISIFLGDGWDFCSEIHVLKGEVTEIYTIETDVKDGNLIPTVNFETRIIKRNNKELKSSYCTSFCNRMLKIDNTHTLKIEISEPHKHDGKSKNRVLKNYLEVENYLIGLDNSLNLTKVYETVMNMLSFNDEDIQNSAGIKFSFIENIDKKEKVLSTIYLIKGEIKEYAILENGKTFHVFREGNWRYSDESIDISYNKEKDAYVFSIAGTEKCITEIKPSEIICSAKKRVSEIWETIK